MPTRILLELCIASLEDALAAAEGGAGRVELNSALEVGGLTPSAGLVREVVESLDATPTSVVAMIRPRPGGFCYSKSELRVMQRDIAMALRLGVDGIAMGVLTNKGEVDDAACQMLIEPVLAAGKQAVFHRAFDVTPNAQQALESLVRLGFARVLTSGQASSAWAGVEVIAALIQQAKMRIEILPGAGITADNIADLVRHCGCTQVHGSLRKQRRDDSTRHRPDLRFGAKTLGPESQFGATDPIKVGQMVEVLKGL